MKPTSALMPILGVLTGCLCAPLWAQESTARPASLEACLALASDTARLACYDQASGYIAPTTEQADQAAVLQRAQVPAHGRGSEIQCGGELAGAVWPRTQQVDRAPSHRVGERAENAVDGRAQSSSRVLVVKPPSASHSSAVFTATVTPKVQIWPSGSRAR